MRTTFSAMIATALLAHSLPAIAAPLDLFNAPPVAALEGVAEDHTSAATAALVERVAAAEFCTQPKREGAPGSIVIWYERDQQGRCTITRAARVPVPAANR